MSLIEKIKIKGIGRTNSQLLWVLFGAAYGLGMRVMFGLDLAKKLEIISIAFLLGTPFVIGTIVVYGLRHTKPSITKMLFAPWVAIILAMGGAAVTLLEGSICIALALPVFLIFSSIGGLVMGLCLRYFKPGMKTLNSFLVLPIALLVVDPAMPQAPKLIEEHTSVDIAAKPHTIWKNILNARNINREELPLNFTHWIGVPRPVEGVNVKTPEGEVRYSKWERGVHFSALVTNKIENRSITWRYKFDDTSFPKGSMDDHVKIGGRYFDLCDTTFNLVPVSENVTRLEIISHYRVTTNVNFYAIPVAHFIAQDFMLTILQLYKSRSENG